MAPDGAFFYSDRQVAATGTSSTVNALQTAPNNQKGIYLHATKAIDGYVTSCVYFKRAQNIKRFSKISVVYSIAGVTQGSLVPGFTFHAQKVNTTGNIQIGGFSNTTNSFLADQTATYTLPTTIPDEPIFLRIYFTCSRSAGGPYYVVFTKIAMVI